MPLSDDNILRIEWTNIRHVSNTDRLGAWILLRMRKSFAEHLLRVHKTRNTELLAAELGYMGSVGVKHHVLREAAQKAIFMINLDQIQTQLASLSSVDWNVSVMDNAENSDACWNCDHLLNESSATVKCSAESGLQVRVAGRSLWVSVSTQKLLTHLTHILA